MTRQTSVLACQFGDGFSNVFTPTMGYLMVDLALFGVPWARWVRFLTPFRLIWITLGLLFLLITRAIQLGPY